MKLADIVTVESRYSRSVNLERDIGNAASLSGYILSKRNCSNVARILGCVSQHDHPRAWTITGLYGTGKSAFANFLLGLFGSSDTPHHGSALGILKSHGDYDSQLFKSFRSRVGRRGLVRVFVTASREPLSHTIVRGLSRGASEFWEGTRGGRPAVIRSLNDANEIISQGKQVSSAATLAMAKALAVASKSGIIILVDELGKNLEYAASEKGQEDLYLLQQLAELPSGKSDPIVCVIGVLHQAFSEYTQKLTTIQQREWAKIQGRFEDIPFHESPLQLTKLIAKALTCRVSEAIEDQLSRFSKNWEKRLSSGGIGNSFSASEVLSLYPLHPLAALVLPQLSERFAQNDRSIFTFLSSQEPHSLGRFLIENHVDKDRLPTLKLHHLFDYFIESLGLGMANHRLFQRWAEIQSAVSDAESLGVEHQQLLKTVGVLNLVTTAGECRATPNTVLMAMVDDPNEPGAASKWKSLLKGLVTKSLVLHRKQVDELRIWQGSDFDVSGAVELAQNAVSQSAAELLNEYFRQTPLIASRHSYQTGTLRYFERCYLDREMTRREDFKVDSLADGVLYYWIDEGEPDRIELRGALMEKKPLLMVKPDGTESVIDATKEFAALQLVLERSPEIRNDGVARKELKHRMRIAREVVDRALQLAFRPEASCVFQFDGEKECRELESRPLSNLCSDLLCEAYNKGPVLSNELINRRSLTSQAAAARRLLFEHMIEHEGQPQLGIEGNGPERSIFESVLRKTGIYRKRQSRWKFGTPTKGSGVDQVWKAVERFCLDSRKTPASIDELYNLLARPPYGARSEVISLFLVAVLLAHAEDVVVYYQGSFIPALTTASLELLVKHPDRFSVMYFEVAGARKKLFSRLESILNVSTPSGTKGIRNVSLLGVLKPLVRFVRSLPDYTIKTDNLDLNAIRVREALIQGRHPDKLVFEELPKACGLLPIEVEQKTTENLDLFKSRFAEALQALETAYDQVLNRNTEKLSKNFAIDGNVSRLREHLRVRSSSLLAVSVEPRLRRFLMAAVEDSNDDGSWLESICMVISDKPVPSWSDDNERLFEVQVNEIARRFMNLEALDKVMTARFEKAFDARRVVLTKPDGTERQRVLWLEEETKTAVEEQVSILMAENDLFATPERFQAAIAVMLDQLLEMPESASGESGEKELTARKKHG